MYSSIDGVLEIIAVLIISQDLLLLFLIGIADFVERKRDCSRLQHNNNFFDEKIIFFVVHTYITL